MKHPGHTYGGFVPSISERGMTVRSSLTSGNSGGGTWLRTAGDDVALGHGGEPRRLLASDMGDGGDAASDTETAAARLRTFRRRRRGFGHRDNAIGTGLYPHPWHRATPPHSANRSKALCALTMTSGPRASVIF
jgi:hypothetical protein